MLRSGRSVKLVPVLSAIAHQLTNNITQNPKGDRLEVITTLKQERNVPHLNKIYGSPKQVLGSRKYPASYCCCSSYCHLLLKL